MTDTKKSTINRREFLKTGTAASVGATAMGVLTHQEQVAAQRNWDRTVDVVVIGAGASGLCAAIRARDLGASVLVIDENTDVGGHAILSGGNVRLGGGTSIQKKYKVNDTPDMVYLENTRPDHPQTRYN